MVIGHFGYFKDEPKTALSQIVKVTKNGKIHYQRAFTSNRVATTNRQVTLISFGNKIKIKLLNYHFSVKMKSDKVCFDFEKKRTAKSIKS